MATKKNEGIETDATLPDVSAAQVKEAKLEGVKEAISEGAKQRFQITDGVAQEGEEAPGIQPTNNALHIADLLDMDPDELKKMLKGKGETDQPIPTQGQIASLLEMERSGQNRDDVVSALCDVLGIKSPYEVTNAGPNYTNVVNRKTVKRD